MKLEAPRFSPDWAKLSIRLKAPEFHQIISEITTGQVLNKHQTFLAATFLLTDPDLNSFYFKAMHFELPKPDKLSGHKTDEKVFMIHNLDDGISNALYNGVKGTISLDIFHRQFEDNQFNFRLTNPDKAIHGLTNFHSLRALFYRDKKLFQYETVSHVKSELNARKIIQGLLQRDIHMLADGMPSNPLNIFRYHDHRKGMFFYFKNKPPVFLLHTGNFDNPHDFDCGLVVTDTDIIANIQQLYIEKIPQNEIIRGKDWTIYQDGGEEIVSNPENHSPILTRVNELINDPSTHEIIWSSQFLPDIQDLKKLEEKLQTGTLRKLEIYAPHPKLWTRIYRASGGVKSYRHIKKLITQYPDTCFCHFTYPRYNHAKIIQVNGGEYTLLGSHNFNRQLVRSRTVELSLELKNITEITRLGLEQFFFSLHNEV